MRTTFVAATLSILLLAGCASAGSGSSGSGGQNAATDAASLIRERCTRCHAVDRIKSAQHDAAGWEQTVGRMRGRGADLSDAEAASVVEFLSVGGGSKL
jgi:osmotically-inducible protein OsmY